MKGTNKVLFNSTQMCEIIQEWWNRHTLSAANGVVTNVGWDGHEFVFEVTLSPMPEEVK